MRWTTLFLEVLKILSIEVVFVLLESESIHVPYWAKKRAQHVQVMTLHAYHWQNMKDLKKALDDALANASSGSVSQADQYQHDDQKGDHPGKGKGKQMKHGGWLTKCSYLVKAVVDRDDVAAFQIADDYSQHPVMAKLLDNIEQQIPR